MTWANANYAYKKSVTVDKSKVKENITDFPMMVHITDGNLADAAHGGHCCRSDGYDIIFYDTDDSTQLSHELVYYNPNTGELYAYVKCTLATAANKVIYMYYGYASESNQTTTATWNSDYAAVYHMKDYDTSHVHDSTVNANTMTKVSANKPIEAAGVISRCQNFNRGNPDYMDATNRIVSTGSKTIFLWKQYHVNNTFQTPLSNSNYGDSSDNNGITDCITGTNNIEPDVGNGVDAGHYFNTPSQACPDFSNWHHYALRQNGSTGFYLDIDGANVKSDTTASGTEVAGSNVMRLGQSWHVAKYPWDGLIEEVEFLSVYKTVDYCTTVYNNQYSPGTFMNFGAEVAGATDWAKALSDTMTLTDTIKTEAVYYRTLSDTMTLTDSIQTTRGLFYSLSDTMLFSDVLSILKYTLPAVFTIAWGDSPVGASNCITANSISIYMPYWNGQQGDLNFDLMNLSFEGCHSTNYVSYIQSVNDERVVLAGYDAVSPMPKFTMLGSVADEGSTVTVSGLSSIYNGVYVIENISINPIGIDVFEYRITLRYVRDS